MKKSINRRMFGDTAIFSPFWSSKAFYDSILDSRNRPKPVKCKPCITIQEELGFE